MTNQPARLPSRKWSIVALASAGMLTVVFSYLLLIALAIGFLALPFVLFLFMPSGDTHFIFARLMLSAFGLVAGLIILSSLFSGDSPLDLKGILIDLSRERRLARETRIISGPQRAHALRGLPRCRRQCVRARSACDGRKREAPNYGLRAAVASDAYHR